MILSKHTGGIITTKTEMGDKVASITESKRRKETVKKGKNREREKSYAYGRKINSKVTNILL